ncbi:hypothetical protein K7432_008723 [Basidiobolus ranarum]|uniref:Uncharacterized protein n=1 Tax=Basidiobolus ranarum TaxID=34480 RepID=A0ABR2VYM9_9FUNG
MSKMDDIVRAVANTSIQFLLNLRYTELLDMSSDELFQRAKSLAKPSLSKEQELELLQWNHGIGHYELANYKSELNYSVPVRYKRFDRSDLRAFIEMQKVNGRDEENFGIVLRLEEGWVYFDICRGLSAQDKLDWSNSLKEAEQNFDNCRKNIESYRSTEEEEASYWTQYGHKSDNGPQVQKETIEKDESECWSPYDQNNKASEADLVLVNEGGQDNERKCAELQVSDEFFKELERIEKGEFLSQNHIAPGEEKDDEFIQVSAYDPTESTDDTDYEDNAFSPPQIISPILPSDGIQETFVHSLPQASLNSLHSRNITEPDSEMASRLDLASMLTFAMGNLNVTQDQQSQWKPMISQLLRLSKDMAKLVGLSDVEVVELLHDAYGDIVPSL